MSNILVTYVSRARGLPKLRKNVTVSSHGSGLLVLGQGLKVGPEVSISAVLLVLMLLGKRHDAQHGLELPPEGRVDRARGVIEPRLQLLVLLVGHSPVRHDALVNQPTTITAPVETKTGSTLLSYADGCANTGSVDQHRRKDLECNGSSKYLQMRSNSPISASDVTGTGFQNAISVGAASREL